MFRRAGSARIARPAGRGRGCRRRLLLLLGLAAAGALVGLAGLYFSLPEVASLASTNPSETAMMRYREKQAAAQGQKLARRWRWVPASRISPALARAVRLAEDDKFYQHQGFDWESMRRALEETIEEKRIRRGGSTITQQLAKNLYLEPTRSPLRKVREAAIAWRLERRLSKARILELYLNVAEWGSGIYGAEAAARHYFGRSASELGPEAAIRLASVLPNPRRYSPLDDRRSWLNRVRRRLAERMHQRGWIDTEELAALQAAFGGRPRPAAGAGGE